MDFFGEDHPTIGRTPEYREVHDPMDLDSTSHNITKRGNSWPKFSRHHLCMDHLCLITVHIVCRPIAGTMKTGCIPQLVRSPIAGSHHMSAPPPPPHTICHHPRGETPGKNFLQGVDPWNPHASLQSQGGRGSWSSCGDHCPHHEGGDTC